MKKKHKIGLFIFLIIAIGLSVPQKLSMPVDGATKVDYNKDTFWYYPLGKSVTHKGIDIFANEGTDLKSATYGIVLFVGEIKVGGNIILILGPKWRIHYYAHLKDMKTSSMSWVPRGKIIGSVGSSGNAKGKSPHVHYFILTPIPYLWRFDDDRQGWKKIFYLNLIDYLVK